MFAPFFYEGARKALGGFSWASDWLFGFDENLIFRLGHGGWHVEKFTYGPGVFCIVG